MPHVDLVEFIGGSAYVDGLLTEPFMLDAEGYLEIPMRPGLGVTLDPAKVSRYSPNASALVPAMSDRVTLETAMRAAPSTRPPRSSPTSSSGCPPAAGSTHWQPRLGKKFSIRPFPGHLRRLGGEFFCLPFGGGGTVRDPVAGWESLTTAPPNEPMHGPAANADWQIIAHDRHCVSLALDLPDDYPVSRIERRHRS